MGSGRRRWAHPTEVAGASTKLVGQERGSPAESRADGLRGNPGFERGCPKPPGSMGREHGIPANGSRVPWGIRPYAGTGGPEALLGRGHRHRAPGLGKWLESRLRSDAPRLAHGGARADAQGLLREVGVRVRCGRGEERGERTSAANLRRPAVLVPSDSGRGGALPRSLPPPPTRRLRLPARTLSRPRPGLGSGATVRSKTRIGALAGSARNKGIVTSRGFRIDPTS